MSYVLATKGRASFLRDALQSYRGLIDDEDELIIVDGGSTDSTSEVVADHADIVSTFISEPDVSEAHAVNKGILMARGRYVKQITDDDIIHKEAMLEAVGLMDDNPEIDVLQCGGYRIWDGDRSAFFVPPGSDYGARPEDVLRLGVCGVGVLTRRSSYARIGLYDAAAVAPDGDFVAGAIARGAVVRFARINLFDHPLLPHSLTVGARRKSYDREVVRIARDHMSTRYYLRTVASSWLSRLPQRRATSVSKSGVAVVWDGGIS